MSAIPDSSEKLSTTIQPSFMINPLLNHHQIIRRNFFQRTATARIMDILKNEVFSKEVLIGNLTIEYSVIDKDGCRVTFTAKDDEHRRIWRTELTDEEGNVKVYSSVQDAINDANRKLKSISMLKDSFIDSLASVQRNPSRKK